MDTKRKIVPLNMVGRTENGTVYFSADEITVVFQFIGVNHFGFGQKKTLKHNRQSTVGTPAHIKSYYLAGLSIQGVHQPTRMTILPIKCVSHPLRRSAYRDRQLLDIACYL